MFVRIFLQLLLIWHAERCWALPLGSPSFIPVKDCLSNLHWRQHPSLLFTSLKTINPSEWQRLSLILDGLNHLLVSTGAPATLLLLEILERWWRWGWSVPNCSVPALCSLCLHPIRNDQFWSEWVKTAELKEKTVTTHMCKRAELQEVCCHETRGPSFI